MLGDVLGEILPLGLAIGLSPFPIIAIVLLLLSERARKNGPLFLLGWAVGTIVAVTVFTLVSSTLDNAGSTGPSWYEGVGQIVIGAVLFVLAVRKWRKFLSESSAELPRWMASITTATPARSLGLGLTLSTVNPKNLLVAAAAGLTLGAAGLGVNGALVGVLGYTVVASITVILPVLGHGLWPTRTTSALEKLEKWLTTNSTALMALILAIFGVVILGNGIAAL